MKDYIVSARKYRPADFESVVGQQHITSTLRNAISREQLAHAYLFCGPRGVGKTTCARIFAKAINCQNPEKGSSCGCCESCRGFEEGRSFNIHELDAASNNSVNDIRSLTEQVRIPPQIGRYSVYIIDEVHMLSASAFNAFLKTLEEPPAHAVFILATTEKHQIIPTILSRCQIFDFNRIRVEDGVGYLRTIAAKEGITTDDESLHLIARKADGGMRDALSMFDKAVSFCGTELTFEKVAQTLNILDYDTYFNLTDMICSGDYPAVLRAFSTVLGKGFSVQNFLSGLADHFRDLLMASEPATASLLEVTGSVLEKYRSQAHSSETAFLISALELVTSVESTLRTAANQRLNVELALIKLCSAAKKNSGDKGFETAHERESLPDDKKLREAVQNTPLGRLSVKEEQPVNVQVSKIAKEPLAAETRHQAESSGATEPYRGIKEAERAPQNNVMVAEQNPSEELRDSSPSAHEQTDNSASQNESKNILADLTCDSAPETHLATERGDAEPAGGSETSTNDDSSSSSAGEQGKETAGSEVLADSRVEDVEPGDLGSRKEKKVAGRPTISGTSISELMGKPKSPYGGAEQTDNESTVATCAIDPDCCSKIEAVRESFIGELNGQRPRIAAAFRQMQVTGNRILITVPTEVLREEILRNKTELLSDLAERAAVEGVIELEVIVKENAGPRKPVRPEEKWTYLSERNPTVALLRKQLDLDLE